MHIVKPIVSNSERPEPRSLAISRGRFFSYALPPGWRVGEDGQFALTLVAPDNHALTVMVGNAGVPIQYSPAQFVHNNLMAIRPENLQIGPPRQTTPLSAFAHAYEFDVSYAVRGAPCRGKVKCHIAPAYDSALMVMTAALSAADQWQGYASWLPLVADQISATSGEAFGRRGIMAQNLQNSVAYGEAARRYREWSQQNWQQVTDQRNASEDRRNFYRRENLGSVQTYVNPYGSTPPLELPMTYKYYWIDQHGTVLGTDDPGANPNMGSTKDWKQMPRYQQ